VSGHRKRSRTLGGRGEGRQEFALEEPGRLHQRAAASMSSAAAGEMTSFTRLEFPADGPSTARA
jgi:hypothetical protein